MEDNTVDVHIMREAIQQTGLQAEIHVVSDGEAATRFFDQADGAPAQPCPRVTILDINLPRRGGDEVLRHLRKSGRCADGIVIATSSSDEPRDRQMMLDLGANAFFRKPSDYAPYLELGKLIQKLLVEKA